MKTTIKDIKKALDNALLKDGKMQYALYKYELEELLDELPASLLADKDEFLFAVTTHKNDVTGKQDAAMVRRLERVYYPFRNVFSTYSGFETLRAGY